VHTSSRSIRQRIITFAKDHLAGLCHMPVWVDTCGKESAMTKSQCNTTQWRKRQTAPGFVRVQVQVCEEDASLVGAIACALRDPSRRETTRAALNKQITTSPAKSFKVLLASAPLDGIELDRQTDFGRENDL
jgi:hypothetical protein